MHSYFPHLTALNAVRPKRVVGEFLQKLCPSIVGQVAGVKSDARPTSRGRHRRRMETRPIGPLHSQPPGDGRSNWCGRGTLPVSLEPGRNTTIHAGKLII